MNIASIVSRLIVAGLLSMSTILVYQGWQQRNKTQPLIPISEATRHDGERVRIRGTIRSAEETPPISVALQTINYIEPPLARTKSDRRRPHRVNIWPAHVIVSDASGEIRIITHGVDLSFITPSPVVYSIGGRQHGTSTQVITPPPGGTYDVRIIKPGEEVEVIGVVNARGRTMHGGGQPIIISNLPADKLAAQHRTSGGYKVALGSSLFVLVLGVFLWFRAGARREINGVKVHPLEVQAARGAVSKQGLQQNLDRLLVEAGADPAEYHRKRKQAKLAGCLILILPPVVFIILIVQLGLII